MEEILVPRIFSKPFLMRLSVLVAIVSIGGGPVPASGVTPVASFAFQPPVPIAARGTLASGTTVNLTVTAKDGGGTAIPGASMWLQFFPTSSSGALGTATACGGPLGAGKTCLADGSGNVVITYKAGAATLGADLVQVQDAAVPTIAPANDSYCYNKGSLKIVPAPMGLKNTILAGAVRAGAVTDLDQLGHPIVGATIALSLAQINPVDANFDDLPPNGSGMALSAGAGAYTSLGLAAKTFVTDSHGQVPFFYRTPTLLPSNLRDDSLLASDKVVRGCLFAAHYEFLPPTNTRTDRIAGPDRYNTAADITGTYAARGSTDTVFIATGQNFPDALAGAAIAGHLGAPILLVNDAGIPAIVATQLSKLSLKHIYILGGSGVVSNAIATQLHSYAADVQRLGGANRYDTAGLIAKHFYPAGVDTVFVATGLNFPDALAGAAVAGHKGAPILLVGAGSGLPAATSSALSALHPNHIVILGGTGVVSAGQASLLAGYAPVARYAGSDRFGTASSIANAYFPSGANIAFIATGLNFPDALAGAAVAGALNAPIELVVLNSIPAPTLSSLQNVVKPHSFVVLGGTGVVSDAVMAQLRTLP
jgi:putative cell wall-binding protein